MSLAVLQIPVENKFEKVMFKEGGFVVLIVAFRFFFFGGWTDTDIVYQIEEVHDITEKFGWLGEIIHVDVIKDVFSISNRHCIELVHSINGAIFCIKSSLQVTCSQLLDFHCILRNYHKLMIK